MIDPANLLSGRVLARSRKRRAPPTFREFAGTLTYPGGPLKGHRVQPDSDPCQDYLYKQFDSGRWERIYVCAPPQYGGKTINGVLVPALRYAVSLRLPVGYGLPTLQDLDKAWSEKLLPALRNSGYGSHLPTSGPGARGGRGHTLQFTDPETGEFEGMLVFLAGGAYGSTVAAAIVDEVDQFRTSDGAPLTGQLEDIFNRANAYGRKALRIAVGTIEHDTQSIIVPLVMEQGTGTRPWLPCHACGGHICLTGDELQYDPVDEETARQSAVLVCPLCAGTWNDSQRLKSLKSALFVHKGQTVEKGAIVGPEPRTSALGLLWNAYESSLTNLGELAVEHFRACLPLHARNDHGLMRKFWRYRRCQVYLNDVLAEDSAPNQLTRGFLCARSEGSAYGPITASKIKDGDGTHESVVCPQEVEGLIVSCDVQRGGLRAPGRLYYLVSGVCGDFRTFDLSWGSLTLAPIGAQPNTAELHSGLDRLHRLALGISELYARPIIRRGIDVGDRQDEIRQWLIRYPEWWPVKGIGHTPKASESWDIPEWIYRREMEGRWNLYEIDVNKVRHQAQVGFLVPSGAPGAAHVPKGLIGTDSLVRHYCGTALVPDLRGGVRWSDKDADRKNHAEWQRRIDLLDCRTYMLALAYQWTRELDRKRAADEYTKEIEARPVSTEPGWLSDYTGDSWSS